MKKLKSIRRCRLCASEESNDNFYDIFDDTLKLDLEKKITKLLPLVVTPWDEMPHVVCLECIKKLNSFNEFYESSLKAEKVLKSLCPKTSKDEGQSREEKAPAAAAAAGPPAEAAAGPPADKEKREKRRPKRSLECFIVNQITAKEFVYTCRLCFTTFTKESSAMTHYCVAESDDDDDDEEEEEGEEKDDEDTDKSLPPLKIPLSPENSDRFVCYVCEMTFKGKTELVEHIKIHYEDGKIKDDVEKKSSKKKRKKRDESQEDGGADDKSDKKKKMKKKRLRKKKKKSSNESTKKEEKSQESWGEIPNSSTPKKETVEKEKNIPQGSDDTDEVKIEKEVSAKEAKKDSSGSDSEEVVVLDVIEHKSQSTSSCLFCDKVFTTKNALIAHQIRHMIGNPVEVLQPDGTTKGTTDTQCKLCGMNFANKSILMHHVKIHLVEDEDDSDDSDDDSL